MQTIQSIVPYANDKGWSDQQKLEAVNKESRGRDPQGESYINGLVYSYSALPFILFVSPEATFGTLVTGALIGGGADIAVQKSSKEPYDYMDIFYAAGIGALMQGKSTAANIGLTVLAEAHKSLVKNDSVSSASQKALATTTASSLLEKPLDKWLPSGAAKKVIVPFVSSTAVGYITNQVEKSQNGKK